MNNSLLDGNISFGQELIYFVSRNSFKNPAGTGKLLSKKNKLEFDNWGKVLVDFKGNNLPHLKLL